MGIPNTIPTYTNAVQVAADATAPSGGVGVLIAADTAGYVVLNMQGGGKLPVYAAVGTTPLDGYLASGWTATGTTASCKVSILY